jgi:predicted transposase/invertase (TIGR01784 family)
MQYYDPKTDVVFKKIFGAHKNLTISLLNAVLKLEDSENKIKDVEYLPSEIMPMTDGKRSNIVDVRCQDANDDYFIVEMQMCWSSDFLRRVMYNSSKVYCSLYNKGERYYKLKRVFAVNILNDIYQKDTAENYHHYKMSGIGNPDSVIQGIEIVCVELPKFVPQNKAQKTLLELWQQFLISIDARTGEENVTKDLLENADVKEALEICRNLTEDEQRQFDSFWDMDFLRKDRDKTMENIGREKGRAEGLAESRKETAIAMLKKGMSVELTAEISKLSVEEVEKLKTTL